MDDLYFIEMNEMTVFSAFCDATGGVNVNIYLN